ncbi:MAG: hypothetical protein KDD22_05425 [Bdellovibrionales bacterium]|nr:hypothetical protein [Bdellovibrionales bacterium]
MKSLLGILISLPLIGACSHLSLESSAPRSFQIHRKWARSTLNTEYLGYRRMHRMQPLLLDNLVI